MSATPEALEGATVATPAPINWELFDRRCAELKKTSERARADLIGVDRSTLWRWRTGQANPSVTKVDEIAGILAVPIAALVASRTEAA